MSYRGGGYGGGAGYNDFGGGYGGGDGGYGGGGYGGGGAAWGDSGGYGGGGGGYDGYGNGGGYDGYGGGYGEYEEKTVQDFIPRDCSDCIFISGLPTSVEKRDIVMYFRAAGPILVSKGVERCFLFMNKETKTPTGDATVTFVDADSASKAIEMFNCQDFNGNGPISVQQATPEQKQPFAQKLAKQYSMGDYNNGGGYGGGGYGGGYGGGRGGGRGRGGDRGRGGYGDRGGRGGFTPRGRGGPPRGRGGPPRGGPRGGFGGRGGGFGGGPMRGGGRGGGRGGRPTPY